MRARQEGFTLIELCLTFITVFIIGLVFVAGIYGTLIKGNFWYTEDGVLKALRIEYPEVEKVLKTTRSAWDYSEILVLEGGVRKTYFLDTDIFWNYEFRTNRDD